jgi:hypothetical protein
LDAKRRKFCICQKLTGPSEYVSFTMNIIAKCYRPLNPRDRERLQAIFDDRNSSSEICLARIVRARRPGVGHGGDHASGQRQQNALSRVRNTS